MSYVERDKEGVIVSVYSTPQDGKDLELVDSKDIELIAFLNKKPEAVTE